MSDIWRPYLPTIFGTLVLVPYSVLLSVCPVPSQSRTWDALPEQCSTESVMQLARIALLQSGGNAGTNATKRPRVTREHQARRSQLRSVGATPNVRAVSATRRLTAAASETLLVVLVRRDARRSLERGSVQKNQAPHERHSRHHTRKSLHVERTSQRFAPRRTPLFMFSHSHAAM